MKRPKRLFKCRDKRSYYGHKPKEDQKFEQIVYQGMSGDTKQTLSEEPKTGETLIKSIGEACHSLDWIHQTSQQQAGIKPACKEGCDYCCYHAVHTTFPEALVAALSVLERSPAEIEAVKQRCRDYISKGSNGLLVLDDVQACPLLEQHRCSVYAYRPLACRGFFSEDAGLCERGMTERNLSMKVPGLHLTWVAYEAVKAALNWHGLDGDRTPLVPLLLRILEAPDLEGLVGRYLEGEQVGAEWGKMLEDPQLRAEYRASGGMTIDLLPPISSTLSKDTNPIRR